jgi:hypothetical protein
VKRLRAIEEFFVSEFESVDYFSDMSLVPDPNPYFDYLRSKCPVQHVTPSGVMAVTGPFPPLPFTPEGDDISAQLEEHRAVIPMAEHVRHD